jgi:S1-C subfamily serine protease
MRHYLLIPLAVAVHAGSVCGQVVAKVAPKAALQTIALSSRGASAIGLITASSADARDTLGLLITRVTAGSMAEKAGLEEGNRITAVNGVSIKLVAADVGDPMLSDLMQRRLTRELAKVPVDGDVELRVYASGQMKTVKVQKSAAKSLQIVHAIGTRLETRKLADRGSIGISLASVGSKRDTLGVFVIGVDETGPAAKAGIEEGQRIAAVNGIDLRVAREDAGDPVLTAARVRRLQRELESLKPGDPVELRVFANGQTRTIKLTAIPMTELPKSGKSVMIYREGGTSRPLLLDHPGMEFLTLDADHGRLLERLELGKHEVLLDSLRLRLKQEIRTKPDTTR